ncbi:DUF2380 domain-containing protein [Paroceanicella profunda]|uniref:DUF2380 domain-containing protein n=1 Tax=Paroceanicella profunda TaxID=2579971 RepID=A0A5B8FXM7_9RHOB|nr:DUF2380 domain-containing protein [Paroceanicella profunda]QDL93255.1 DUF2380 domain-containing protein [Paroceanicella profunda]
MRGFLMSAVLCLGAVLAGPGQALTLGIMPIKLLDTSGEGTDQAAVHGARIDAMGDALGRDLAARYGETLLIAPRDVSTGCPTEDAQCLIDVAAAAGADQALFMVVVKTSELIMQMYVQIVDVPRRAVVQKRELNFRGDTDESWRRAGQFLVDNLRTP